MLATQEANLIVQLLLLGVVVWYAWETCKIRRVSQDQLEALQKPCLTLVTEARDYDAALLELNGAVGGMIVAARNGNVALQNMGYGPAVNVTYNFKPVNPSEGVKVAGSGGYLQNIPAGGTFAMQVARGSLALLEYELIVTYESLGGHRYESKIAINNLVLTAFNFEVQKPLR
jgi:hypothetical protein